MPFAFQICIKQLKIIFLESLKNYTNIVMTVESIAIVRNELYELVNNHSVIDEMIDYDRDYLIDYFDSKL